MNRKKSTTPLLSLGFICLLLVLSGCSGGRQTSAYHFKKVQTSSYVIKGVRYRPQKYYEYVGYGLASHYGHGDVFHGRLTATGEVFDKNGMTAAHRTLPIPCLVKVTNVENGRSVKLKVNDRGPFVDTHKRIIDVSSRAAKVLGFYNKGLGRVRVEVLVPESIRLARGGNWVQRPVVPSTRLPVRRRIHYTRRHDTPVHQSLFAQGRPLPKFPPFRRNLVRRPIFTAGETALTSNRSVRPSRLPWFRRQ